MTEKLNGIIVLNKPAGMTSHDCVAKIRRLAKTKRVGHTGTLDPAVTGVLPICIGNATRVAEYLLEYQKDYIAEITLGRTTTTEDQLGDIIEDQPVQKAPSEQDILQVLDKFIGDIEQIPPMYSAVKVNGQRLHQLAREGREVARKSRPVRIYDIKLLEVNNTIPYPKFKIHVSCSKGTYIRTLGVDIGKELGFPAHMTSLIRVKSGPFTLEQAKSFDEIETWQEEDWQEHLLPMDSALEKYPSLSLEDELIQRVKFGQSLALKEYDFIQDSLYRIYDKSGNFIALYTAISTQTIKPKKVFLP